MRKSVLASSLLALGLTLGSAPISAQFFVGANAVMPSGDYADYAKTGWMVTAGYGFWKSSNESLTLWVEGAYGQNSHEGDHGEKTKLMMANADVTYNFSPAANTSPYLIGSVGYLSHGYDAGELGDFDETEGGFGVGAGGGIGFGKFWLEARYVMGMGDLDETKFIMIGAGVSF
jgi:hypothetical protein